MPNWKKCKLGDVATTTTTKISCSDITSNYISTENMLPDKGGIVAASSLPNLGNVSIYHKGDVLVSNIRPYFKKIWHATVDGAASNDVIVFHANEGVNSRYLYYTLADDNFFAYVMTGAKGTKMPRGDKKQMMLYPVFCPPLEEQKRIAEILGSLDDKIELLQKQNKTLEDMAKALFKSWFVDFDVVRAKQKGLPKADIMREYHLTEELYDLFPSSFADSPLGPIPSGWEVKTLGDVVVCHDSKRVPLSNRERSEKQGPYPYYGATSIMDHVENYLFDGIFLLLGEDGSVVKPDGTPFLQYVFGKIWVNNHAHVLQGKGNIRTEYLYLFLSDVQIQPYVTGAVQAKLNQKNMNSIPLCVANEEIIKIFQGNIDIVFTKIRANLKQIQTLTELRDTLLPRLISGKIRV